MMQVRELSDLKCEHLWWLERCIVRVSSSFGMVQSTIFKSIDFVFFEKRHPPRSRTSYFFLKKHGFYSKNMAFTVAGERLECDTVSGSTCFFDLEKSGSEVPP